MHRTETMEPEMLTYVQQSATPQGGGKERREEQDVGCWKTKKAGKGGTAKGAADWNKRAGQSRTEERQGRARETAGEPRSRRGRRSIVITNITNHHQSSSLHKALYRPIYQTSPET